MRLFKRMPSEFRNTRECPLPSKEKRGHRRDPAHLHLVVDHKTPNPNLMRSICWEHIRFIRDPVRHHQIRFLRVVVLEAFLQNRVSERALSFKKQLVDSIGSESPLHMSESIAELVIRTERFILKTRFVPSLLKGRTRLDPPVISTTPLSSPAASTP